MKECVKCKQTKDLSAFSIRVKNRDRLQAQCKVCIRERSKQWRDRNPEKAQAAGSRWRQNNPDKEREKSRRYHAANKAKKNQQSREWYENNKERAEDLRLKAEYGISLEQKRLMFVAQDGKCAACASSFDKLGDLHVDHRHDDSLVRGLLCGGCNRALGILKDCPSRISKLLNYIVRFQPKELRDV